MYYFAIDQHAKQLTVNVRNESGTVILRRQVSTRPDKVREFFAAFREQAAREGGYLAILEVCGFNDWLLAMLAEYGCRDTVLVQCEQRSKNKTDSRDADQLGELLWVNRHRILAGQKLQNLRRVVPPSAQDAAARQLTSLRKALGSQRTRVLNRIASILKKHNAQHACPTKGLQTKAARKWLAERAFPKIDRLEMNQLLARWRLLDAQIDEAEGVSIRAVVSGRFRPTRDDAPVRGATWFNLNVHLIGTARRPRGDRSQHDPCRDLLASVRRLR